MKISDALKIGLLSLALLMACFAILLRKSPTEQYSRSHPMSRMKQLGTAFILYSQENDQLFPGDREWQETISPYLKDSSLFESQTRTGVISTAMESQLAYQRIYSVVIGLPILLFEVPGPIKNASGRFQDYPFIPFYRPQNRSSEGGFVVTRADTSVKFLGKKAWQTAVTDQAALIRAALTDKEAEK